MENLRKAPAAVVGIFSFLLLGNGVALHSQEIKNTACLECHADKTLYKTNASGKGIAMFVDEARLKLSVHKTNTCASCHSDITSKHPDDNVPARPPNSANCH